VFVTATLFDFQLKKTINAPAAKSIPNKEKTPPRIKKIFLLLFGLAVETGAKFAGNGCPPMTVSALLLKAVSGADWLRIPLSGRLKTIGAAANGVPHSRQKLIVSAFS